MCTWRVMSLRKQNHSTFMQNEIRTDVLINRLHIIKFWYEWFWTNFHQQTIMYASTTTNCQNWSLFISYQNIHPKQAEILIINWRGCMRANIYASVCKMYLYILLWLSVVGLGHHANIAKQNKTKTRYTTKIWSMLLCSKLIFDLVNLVIFVSLNSDYLYSTSGPIHLSLF